MVLATAALAGCDAKTLLGGLAEASDLYTLSPKSTFDSSLPVVAWQLVVEEPIAAGGLNSNRIAWQASPLELQYLANANWTERAPRMMQTLLVESFENSGRIIAVGRQAIGLRSDFNLMSELREFQAEQTAPNAPPIVRVRLNAKVVRQPGRAIIASDNFEAVAEARSLSMFDIVLAFDEATGKVLKRVVEWTLIVAERDRQERQTA